MAPGAIAAIGAAVLVGAFIGFVLGRYAGGGWLFAFSLLLAAVAAGMMSSEVLTALGISNENWAHMGYAAFGMLILLPAMAGSILAGAVGLRLAARAARAEGPE